MTQTVDEIAGVQPPASRPARGAQPRPPGILVVDDNEAIRAVLDAGARASGFAVWLAAGGCEGVAFYREHSSAIDVVLLDVRLPDWDGPETLMVIRSVAPHVPCCFMSGDTGHYTEEYLLGLGAVAVFQKPFRLDELLNQLRQFAALGEQHEKSQEDRWEEDGGRGAEFQNPR